MYNSQQRMGVRPSRIARALEIPVVLFLYVVGAPFIVLAALYEAYEKFKVNRVLKDEVLDEIAGLIGDGKYVRAKEIFDSRGVYLLVNRMEPEQRIKTTKMYVTCLENLSELDTAVIVLARELSWYWYSADLRLWSQALLEKWIELYRRCGELQAEQFHFGEHGGMMIETVGLLKYAVEERKVPAPAGFEKEQEQYEKVLLKYNQIKVRDESEREMSKAVYARWVIKQKGEWQGILIRESSDGVLEKVGVSQEEIVNGGMPYP